MRRTALKGKDCVYFASPGSPDLARQGKVESRARVNEGVQELRRRRGEKSGGKKFGRK
jgi:hypothetical protein